MTNTFLLMPHSFNVQSPQSECLIPSSTTGELTFNPQRLTNQIRMSLEELYEKGSKVRKALSAATTVHLIGPHAVDSHAHLGCCVACACVWQMARGRYVFAERPAAQTVSALHRAITTKRVTVFCSACLCGHLCAGWLHHGDCLGQLAGSSLPGCRGSNWSRCPGIQIIPVHSSKANRVSTWHQSEKPSLERPGVCVYMGVGVGDVLYVVWYRVYSAGGFYY